MRILAIETSCDETSAAVLEGEIGKENPIILSNIIASSVILHSKTGGIIPEIAAREQLRYIIPVVDKALIKAGCLKQGKNPIIDAIAVTVGPGLIGSLLVGVETTKTLAWIWNKPIIPINHLIGHIYANFIGNKPKTKNQKPKINNDYFPAIALIASGGHTDLVLLKKHGVIQWLGGTRDDAAGEAFDKIGRLLGLPYPAGPMIEKFAHEGNSKRFRFPRPLIHENTFDFSFSGLKTAVLRETQKLQRDRQNNSIEGIFDYQTICDFSYAAQAAIIEVLTKKTLEASKKYQTKSILLGGGVAANQTLVEAFRNSDNKIIVPQKLLCTDNAAMIGAAAFFYYEEKNWKQVTAKPELYFDL